MEILGKMDFYFDFFCEKSHDAEACEILFDTEEEAMEYAEENGLKNYMIIGDERG